MTQPHDDFYSDSMDDCGQGFQAPNWRSPTDEEEIQWGNDNSDP